MCYIYSRAQNKLIVNISNKMIFSFLVFRTLITMSLTGAGSVHNPAAWYHVEQYTPPEL